MRIAYLNGEDLTKTGGGGVHFRAVATELAGLDNKVYVVAPKYSAKPWVELYADNLEQVKIPVPGKNILGLFCFELLLLLGLPWFKLKYRWDALLVRGGGPSLIIGLVFVAARLLGIKVVLECNGVSWLEFQSRGFPKPVCAFVKFSAWSQAKAASSIIGVTPAICQAYCDLANRPIRDSYPISNGVFTEKFPLDQRPMLRKRYAWDDSRTVLVMPSGFTPWHGLDMLVEALSMVPAELRSKLCCVLPGGGVLLENIRNKVETMGLSECVQLPDHLNRDEIYDILTAADVGMFLCTEAGKLAYPGSPLKLFEYFGAGLPVITCPDSYHSRLVPYYSLGTVLDSNTPESLARAICDFAETKAGDADRRRILETAREEFHWRKVAQRVLAVVKGQEPELEKWLAEESVIHSMQA